jgi:hypothetical protein
VLTGDYGAKPAIWGICSFNLVIVQCFAEWHKHGHHCLCVGIDGAGSVY